MYIYLRRMFAANFQPYMANLGHVRLLEAVHRQRLSQTVCCCFLDTRDGQYLNISLLDRYFYISSFYPDKNVKLGKALH